MKIRMPRTIGWTFQAVRQPFSRGWPGRRWIQLLWDRALGGRAGRRRWMDRWRRARSPAIAVAALGAAAFLVLAMPECTTPAFDEAARGRLRGEVVNDARATWAQVALGLLGALGLYLAWQRLELARQAQVTNRFTQAIAQLGANISEPPIQQPNLEVRFGAIFALERIARESERNRWPIMEVLTAYVRQNAPAVSAETALPGATGEASDETGDSHKPRVDVQAALTVIGRRAVERESLDKRLDLANCDLRGADLRDARLERANMASAQLQGATLRWALLRDAFLHRAQLQKSHLGGAQLQGAWLLGARLQAARLRGAQLQGAYLDRAELQNAQLNRADLQGASLIGAQLQGAWLEGAQVDGVRLGGADLRDADLRSADLSKVQGLTQEQVNVAIGNSETVLPGWLTRPAHWR